GRGPLDDARPSGLVAGAEPCTVVAVKVLIEEDAVAPVRIALELLGSSIDRAPPIAIAQEDAGEPAAELLGHLVERHPPSRAGRTFDREIVAVVRVVLQQRAD